MQNWVQRFLTHLRAYDLTTKDFQHIYEDIWISKAPPEEIVEYFVLAFQILKNVGLPATGITSSDEPATSIRSQARLSRCASNQAR